MKLLVEHLLDFIYQPSIFKQKALTGEPKLKKYIQKVVITPAKNNSIPLTLVKPRDDEIVEPASDKSGHINMWKKLY